MSRFLEAATALGADLALARMSGHEELGRLPEFHLEFISPRRDIKPAEILGKNITWALALRGGGVRHFNGFVTRFAEAGEVTTAAHEQGRKGQSFLYRAEVHPWLWFLTRTSTCRAYQNMSALDILDAVFANYKFADVKKMKLAACPKREFSVQYRETDFNFVCRLMEQEGIYYAYDYGDGRNTLVLMSSAGGEVREVAFHDERQAAVDKDYISSCDANREIQPGKYVIDDYCALTPHLKLTGTGVQPRDHDLSGFEIFDYPGEYRLQSEGNDYAKIRIEEWQTRFEQFTLAGSVREAAPGCKLKLLDHPRRTDYLVTAVSHAASAGELASGGGSGEEYRCSLSAIDAKTEFRPARITPRPIIQGPQTAFVVGPGGQEIWTDEHGRIKVQFHWDRYSKTDENSSCWVRVAQPLAGSKWGFFALPRIGQEVVVHFLEGDPDNPIVIGSVYNAALKPPYTLPDEKTRSGIKTHSSPGGTSATLNELRFEDKKGEEQIFVQAEKDKVIRIKHDRLEWVGNDNHLIVKQHAFEKIEGDHHVALKGDRNEKLDGALSLKVGGQMQSKIGTKLAYDAGTEIHLKAGTTLVLEAGASLSLKVGGNYISLNPGGVFITGTMVMINSGGAAGSGSGASPQPPKDPTEAGKTEGGDMTAAPKKEKPQAYGPQAQMFKMAAASGTPFCEICNC